MLHTGTHSLVPTYRMLRTVLYGVLWVGRNQATVQSILGRPELGYYGAFWVGRNQAYEEHSCEVGTKLLRSILGRPEPG